MHANGFKFGMCSSPTIPSCLIVSVCGRVCECAHGFPCVFVGCLRVYHIHCVTPLLESAKRPHHCGSGLIGVTGWCDGCADSDHGNLTCDGRLAFGRYEDVDVQIFADWGMDDNAILLFCRL